MTPIAAIHSTPGCDVARRPRCCCSSPPTGRSSSAPRATASRTETGLLRPGREGAAACVWERNVGEGYSGPVGRRRPADPLPPRRRRGGGRVPRRRHRQGHWKFAYADDLPRPLGKGDGPRSTPLIAGNRVYTLGADGQLHCLELDDGKKVWQRVCSKGLQAYRPASSASARRRWSRATCCWSTSAARGPASSPSTRTPARRCGRRPTTGASYSSPVAATIDGMRHVFFFTRDGLVSLWTRPTARSASASAGGRASTPRSTPPTPLVVDGDRLPLRLLRHRRRAAAREEGRRRGGVEERRGAVQPLQHAASTHDGYLYGFDGRQEAGARLRCVELKTGKVRWTREELRLRLDDPGRRQPHRPDRGRRPGAGRGDAGGYREKARASVLSTARAAPRSPWPTAGCTAATTRSWCAGS